MFALVASHSQFSLMALCLSNYLYLQKEPLMVDLERFGLLAASILQASLYN